jgi:hypothetical protein
MIFKAYSIVNWRSFFCSNLDLLIVSEWSWKDHDDSEAGDEEHEQLLTLLDPPLDLLHLQDVAHLEIRLEMEFLDINLTKDLILLLHAIHSQLPNIKSSSAWAYHRVPTLPPFFLYR